MNEESFRELRMVMTVAIGLIVVALVSIGIADHFNWRELSGAGLTVLGYGGGILQGKGMTQQTTTKGGGDIVNAADATAPKQ